MVATWPLCTILYIRVRWAIALLSTRDCHPVVLIMFVTLDSLLWLPETKCAACCRSKLLLSY